jgi:hypothetical protein
MRQPFKKIPLVLVALVFGALAPLMAQEVLPEDIVQHPNCVHCGMNREQWSHTRHLVEYRDGHVEPTCSLRCAALSLDMNWGRTPIKISGAAMGTKAKVEPLMPVERLHYVLRDDQRGTMARRSKYAYSSRGAAHKAAGKVGILMDFEQALEAAFQDVVFQVMQKRKQVAKRSRRRRK